METHDATRLDPPQSETEAAPTQTITLRDRHVLVIEHGARENRLHLLNSDHNAGLVITIDSKGISLRVTGENLTLEAEGALAIRADQLSMYGHNGVNITSGADLSLQAEGDLSSEARTQNLCARLGSVLVKANDDVKLLGERIRLNT